MRQFTEAEFQEIAKAEGGLRHVGFDVDHEGANHNGNLVLQYFQANPTVPVTVANIYGYIEKNKAQFIWRTQAQMEYDKLERENPAAATAVANWLTTQGRVEGQLVNVGDQGFENASLLLVELRGRNVNPTTIYQAIGRLNHRVGRNLHFVPKPSKQVEPGYKPGRFIEDANISPGEYARRTRIALEEKRESPATISKREQAAAMSEAESLRGWSHSENAQLSRIFVTDEKTREIDWVATRNARLKLQKTFENRRATSYRIT